MLGDRGFNLGIAMGRAYSRVRGIVTICYFDGLMRLRYGSHGELCTNCRPKP